MKDRRRMLKVKIKSLATEARLIRLEERRTTKRQYIRPAVSSTRVWMYNGDNELREELHLHRVGIVRSEQRHTLLAYGFLRGRTLEQMEKKSDTAPDWDRVRKMVEKYGVVEYGRRTEQAERFKEWTSGVIAAK